MGQNTSAGAEQVPYMSWRKLQGMAMSDPKFVTRMEGALDFGDRARQVSSI